MICVNFSITLFDLKGMLQRIFDCLYITAHSSNTSDQIFMNAMGIKHLFFISLVCLNLHLIGLTGALYLFFFLVIDCPRGGQRLLGETYLLMPCLEELCCVDHQTVLTARRRCFFFFQSHCRCLFFINFKESEEEFTFASPVCTICTHVWSPSSESVIRLKLFLPCLEVVEPLALVRRWRTESGLWWRVES